MAIEGTFLTYVKETLTILRPMRSIVNRGVASDQKQSPTLSLRITKDDLEVVAEAAAAIDVPKTAFVRWAAVAAAHEILKQKKEYDRLHK